MSSIAVAIGEVTAFQAVPFQRRMRPAALTIQPSVAETIYTEFQVSLPVSTNWLQAVPFQRSIWPLPAAAQPSVAVRRWTPPITCVVPEAIVAQLVPSYLTMTPPAPPAKQ